MQPKHLVLSGVFQRTVTTPLNLCLSPGVHFSQPLYPLLISVEARLIFDSQGLILPATLSDEVASVRQIGRTEGASLRERLLAAVDN